MLTKFLLPLLAVVGVGMAVYTVTRENKPRPVTPPVVEPATAPFASYVAGAGLVEARTENLAIGSHVAGIITQVHVRPGQRVEAGAPLFTIDDRTAKAELASREAALAVARSRLEKLQAEPRPEDIPPLQARVEANRSLHKDLEAQLAMWEKADPRAVAGEELSKKRFAVVVARARLTESEADLQRLKAGAWKLDIDIARSEIDAAQAQVEAARVELERRTVTAPVAGEILKLNARLGEFAPGASQGSGSGSGGGGGGGGNLADALLVLGDTSLLHVRVDVDENDAWRVKAGAAGKAFVRGNPSLHTDLTFVRFEPYVIPKKSLTGASTERVDTRVLQVIFSFDPRTLPVFVGQQMDVFIDAPAARDVDSSNPAPAPHAAAPAQDSSK